MSIAQNMIKMIVKHSQEKKIGNSQWWVEGILMFILQIEPEIFHLTLVAVHMTNPHHEPHGVAQRVPI